MGRLENKVAIVTGAANGIGASTVRRFVDEGARVVATDIDDGAGSAVVADLGDRACYLSCDVSNEADVEAAVALALSRFGRIDAMFNNAGIIGVRGSITQTTYDDWRGTLAVLLDSVFFGLKHAGAAMIEQGHGGSLISTASTAGLRGGLAPHAYTAAKHGVIGLTKSVANELAPHEIRVNAISPGNTVTAMTATAMAGDPSKTDQTAEAIASKSPLGYAGFPEDIANAALYLASDEARYMSGHTMVVDAGQTSAGLAAHRFHEIKRPDDSA